MASMHPVASRLDTFQRRSSNSSCEAPAEEKLFCSCSSLSASVALMMQPSVPVMANETATAADLCYCVTRASGACRCCHELDSCDSGKKNCRRERDCIRFTKWLHGAAWSALASGRRTTIRIFLPPTLFDESATAVTMRRSPTSRRRGRSAQLEHVNV